MPSLNRRAPSVHHITETDHTHTQHLHLIFHVLVYDITSCIEQQTEQQIHKRNSKNAKITDRQRMIKHMTDDKRTTDGKTDKITELYKKDKG